MLAFLSDVVGGVVGGWREVRTSQGFMTFARTCPRCGGDDRFSINTEKKLWNCRHCKEGGNVIDLVMFLDGVKLDAACTTLTGQQPPGRDENAAGASTAKRDTETRQAARR